MRSPFLATILTGALALGAFTGPAAAESTKDRVDRLEQIVSDLQAAAPSTSASAVRITQLEREIQELTGRIEELSFDLDQANSRLEAVTAALSVGGAGPGGPQALGGPLDFGSGDPIADRIAGAGQSTGGPADAPSVELPLDPSAAFDYASSFLMAGDYQRAQSAFEIYVKSFPNHPRTPDAKFRLGEIYLATGANADAADTFIDHIKKYPNDPRAAEAYLKLGTAFARMDQSGEACKVFKAMRSKYPNASPAVQQRADIEMSRISCK